MTYLEVTAAHEGHWSTSQMLTGLWEHTQTLLLQDTADGQTLAQLTGWWTQPAPVTADFTNLRINLNGLAAKTLDRLAQLVETGPKATPVDQAT